MGTYKRILGGNLTTLNEGQRILVKGIIETAIECKIIIIYSMS